LVSSLVILFKKSKKLFFILIASIFLFLNSMNTNISEKVKFYTTNVLNDSVTHQIGFYGTGGQVYRLFIPNKDSHGYTITDWISYISRGWYHLLSEPMLSVNNTARFILFFPVKIVFLILCILAVPGIWMTARYGHIEAVIFLSVLITIGSGIAISSGNVGTMLRHRDVITPVIFIFSSFYISRLIGNYLKIKV
jgi:hypothetical protein